MLKKENKLIFIVTIVLLMISLMFLLIVLNFDSFITLKSTTMLTKVTIGDHSGIDVSPDVLSFGNVSQGSFGHRNVSIGNDYDFPVGYEFSVEGNISEFLVFSERVYLDVGQQKEIVFSTILIEDDTKGYYSGIITVKIKKWVN